MRQRLADRCPAQVLFAGRRRRFPPPAALILQPCTHSFPPLKPPSRNIRCSRRGGVSSWPVPAGRIRRPFFKRSGCSPHASGCVLACFISTTPSGGGVSGIGNLSEDWLRVLKSPSTAREEGLALRKKIFLRRRRRENQGMNFSRGRHAGLGSEKLPWVITGMTGPRRF